MEIVMNPIGYIKSGYVDKKELPRQSVMMQDAKATIEILESYKEGISDIEAGTYGVVLFYFHKSTGYTMRATSGKTGEKKGVFSLRSPNRPNGIGMSIVKFTRIEEGCIEFEGVDMLDGTPVLDIKPYVEELNPKL
ncbi:MAG: tRNA (N6-threonylcarbamoyladenosine(37)-N6)-methyltransferase TrmO [Clostridia bacterium]|nr:tRNA (N6-threonylcarbamoyladenosine(37)-N6)-methyltransferase TrmO [Clostridia bacterium]